MPPSCDVDALSGLPPPVDWWGINTAGTAAATWLNGTAAAPHL
jgi:hypothetical protein